MSETDTEEATRATLDVLEQWGSESKFIWLRELHRITDIDKGLLRNILNGLKKSKEIKETHGANNRIFFCLRKYHIKCSDAEFRFRNRQITLKDGSRTIVIGGATGRTERTRKRLEKQKNRRRAKASAKKKG